MVDCLYGLWTRVRILRFSSYLPEESPIVRWTPIQREGRVCLYNLPNLAPFCREGLLCPALHSVLSKCVNCPVLEWGRALACMQPISLSSHVMGNGVWEKLQRFFTYWPNLDSFISNQHLPNWNPMLQFLIHKVVQGNPFVFFLPQKMRKQALGKPAPPKKPKKDKGKISCM